MKKALSILIILAVLVCTCCCNKANERPVIPNNTPTSDSVATNQPQVTVGSDAVSTPENQQNTASPTPSSTAQEKIMLSTYTADELIPVLRAVLESEMLCVGGTKSFLPANSDKPIAERVFGVLYAYAQANAYTDGFGASMSCFEVGEIINIAFGDAYTYDKFVADVEANVVSGASLSDDIWYFGEGESMAPSVTYSANADVEFIEGEALSYSYTDAVSGSSAAFSVFLVQSEGNLLGFSIAKITI